MYVTENKVYFAHWHWNSVLISPTCEPGTSRGKLYTYNMISCLEPLYNRISGLLILIALAQKLAVDQPHFETRPSWGKAYLTRLAHPLVWVLGLLFTSPK